MRSKTGRVILLAVSVLVLLMTFVGTASAIPSRTGAEPARPNIDVPEKGTIKAIAERIKKVLTLHRDRVERG